MNCDRMLRLLALAIFWLLIAILLLLPFVGARAHSWYDVECCRDQDCKPVACDEIIETPTGFVYDGVKFDKAMEKPSKDRRCHACIIEYGGARRGLCIYTQQGS